MYDTSLEAQAKASPLPSFACASGLCNHVNNPGLAGSRRELHNDATRKDCPARTFWNIAMRPSLATKFTFLIFGIVGLGLLNGVAALVFTWMAARTSRSIVIENISSVKAAKELGDAMLNQKWLHSAYIIPEGAPFLLEQSDKAEADFAAALPRARATADTAEENVLLDKLEAAYATYNAKRKQALRQFHQGQRKEAILTLRQEVWPAYDDVDMLCNEFIRINAGFAEASVKRGETYAAVASWGVLIGSLGTAGLAALLSWQVARRFLMPLRKMVAEARTVVGPGQDAASGAAEDELRSIGVYFRALMVNVVEKRATLEENRERMLNSEKLASLGKLAASVAHEMRNPLTPMKMWLYSIRKAAGAEPSMDRRYQILADEIGRLESIVHNVLEFSRPLSLKLQPTSVPQVIYATLDVLRPGLEAKNVRAVQHCVEGLPCAMADSLQLRQVFTNLLDNAAAAMPGGGEISISSVAEPNASGKSMIVVRIKDAGPGIPDDVRAHLFEPFFTTKDQGTGLGLCIAANIMARHEGQLAPGIYREQRQHVRSPDPGRRGKKS